MLQCVAGYCRVLQGVAVCCSVSQGVAGCCRVLQGFACLASPAVCCSVLQCVVAVCCSMLQCVAVCCNVLRALPLQVEILTCHKFSKFSALLNLLCKVPRDLTVQKFAIVPAYVYTVYI